MRGFPRHFVAFAAAGRRTIRAPADGRRALPDRRGRPAPAAAPRAAADGAPPLVVVRSTIASVSPGLAAFAQRVEVSPLAGRSNRPTQRRMATRIGCPASHSSRRISSPAALILARIVGVGEQPRRWSRRRRRRSAFPDEAREQGHAADGRRNHVTPPASRGHAPTSLSRKAPRRFDATACRHRSGASAPSLKRWMSATARRLVSTMRLWPARGGAAAKRRKSAAGPGP